MSAIRIGIAVHQRDVRCVAVRGTRVVWTHIELLGEQPLTPALERIYRLMPRRNLLAPRPRIVFGPRFAQQRRLNGLPTTVDHRLVRAVVDENVERFFLRSAARLVVTTAAPCPDNTLMAAALDFGVVSATVSAGRAVGIVPECIAAGVGVLACALVIPKDCEWFEWGEPDERVRVRLRGGIVVSGQLVPRGAPSGELLPAPPLRGELDGHGEGFAEAYGAAVANLRAIPALRRQDLRPATRTRARLLRAVSCTVLVVSIGAWFTAPALVAARNAAHAEKRLMAHGLEQRRIAHISGEARRSAAVVEQVEAFRRQRRSMVSLLSQVSDALPESTAVSSLRVDSLGGTLTLLAPRVMNAVQALAAVPAWDGLQVAGPLLREVTGPKELERITLRFRFRRTVVHGNSMPTPPAVRVSLVRDKSS